MVSIQQQLEGNAIKRANALRRLRDAVVQSARGEDIGGVNVNELLRASGMTAEELRRQIEEVEQAIADEQGLANGQTALRRAQELDSQVTALDRELSRKLQALRDEYRPRLDALREQRNRAQNISYRTGSNRQRLQDHIEACHPWIKQTQGELGSEFASAQRSRDYLASRPRELSTEEISERSEAVEPTLTALQRRQERLHELKYHPWPLAADLEATDG